MAEEAKKQITFKLAHFETIRFHYGTPKNELNEDLSQINFTNNPQIGFDIERNIILIDFTVSASLMKTEEQFLEIQTLFYFEVADLTELVSITNGKADYKHPSMHNFLITITGTSYSTLRGIISEKFKDTVLGKIPLPVVSPASFFKPPQTPGETIN